MADKETLMESGTLLYLKEHTKEMKKLRLVLLAGLILLLGLFIFVFWYAKKYHLIAYLAGAGL